MDKPESILVVSTPKAPCPLGHYSQALSHRGVVYVAGQLPADATEPDRVSPASTFAEQMQQLLVNCAAVLEAADSGPAHVLSLTLHLTDLQNWEQTDQMVANFFGAHRPARTVLHAVALRKGYAVQASMVATVADVPNCKGNKGEDAP